MAQSHPHTVPCCVWTGCTLYRFTETYRGGAGVGGALLGKDKARPQPPVHGRPLGRVQDPSLGPCWPVLVPPGLRGPP